MLDFSQFFYKIAKIFELSPGGAAGKEVVTSHATLNLNRQIRKRAISLVLATMFVLFPTLSGVSMIQNGFSDQHTALLPLPLPATHPSPDLWHSQVGPAKGMFLVASRDLRDPNFSKTVVLLMDYNWQGAMGLIINRPTEVRLSKVFPRIEGLRDRTDTVYIGGPVARSQMMLLIRSSNPPGGSLHIFEDIYASSSQTVVQRMIDNGGPRERFRVYAGYAGWASGQLDGELSRGDWHVLEADGEIVFAKDPLEIWPELIRQVPLLIANAQTPDRGVESLQKP
jgi:putative transcriptional regulator